mmetsp:Transcript_61935/g.175918  ORF Transcript_61935/g.175918 Transcript_61935/m.175918 type:complete len:215 (-) Transcript_61935:1397-2041(-)
MGPRGTSRDALGMAEADPWRERRSGGTERLPRPRDAAGVHPSVHEDPGDCRHSHHPRHRAPELLPGRQRGRPGPHELPLLRQRQEWQLALLGPRIRGLGCCDHGQAHGLQRAEEVSSAALQLAPEPAAVPREHDPGGEHPGSVPVRNGFARFFCQGPSVCPHRFRLHCQGHLHAAAPGQSVRHGQGSTEGSKRQDGEGSDLQGRGARVVHGRQG